MRVYIATSFSAWREAARVADLLAAAGHECTARWIETARELDGECARVPVGDPRRAREADIDLADVARSEAIVVLVPPSGGTGMWVELGYAMRGGARVLCVPLARESFNLAHAEIAVMKRTIFLETEEIYITAVDAVDALGDARRTATQSHVAAQSNAIGELAMRDEIALEAGRRIGELVMRNDEFARDNRRQEATIAELRQALHEAEARARDVHEEVVQLRRAIR